MKLGIAVVYLFNEKSAELLDMHLSHIERHTLAPYTIYAGVNRLAEPYRRRLETYPHVRICPCPETDLRDGAEHAFYLERLVKAAIEDGSTHIVTLHLDSFPVRSGWDQELAGRLSDGCALATIDRINTACLFFHRDFYLTCHPTFLVSEEERKSSEFETYLSEHNPAVHSGIGYGYTACRNGLTWHYLKNDPTRMDGDMPWIYGGLIFHLGGGVRLGEGHVSALPPSRRTYYRWIIDAARSGVPQPVRNFLWTRSGNFFRGFKERLQSELHIQEIEQFKSRLKDRKPPL